jgi:hypothetical protein
MAEILPLLLWLSIPAFFIGLLLRDKWREQRDKHIEARQLHLAKLFQAVAQQRVALTRVYLQSYKGNSYPYHLFMLEYRTQDRQIVTIFLPVRDFLKADDTRLKQVLASELAHPDQYTIPDWTVALFDYIVRHRNDPRHRKLPFAQRILRRFAQRVGMHK